MAQVSGHMHTARVEAEQAMRRAPSATVLKPRAQLSSHCSCMQGGVLLLEKQLTAFIQLTDEHHRRQAGVLLLTRLFSLAGDNQRRLRLAYTK
jgi:hypothetical protein